MSFKSYPVFGKPHKQYFDQDEVGKTWSLSVEVVLHPSSLNSVFSKNCFDLILLDASTSENDLVKNDLEKLSVPLLYIETDLGVYYELDQKLVLKSSFAEEDFLHKYHLAEELLKKHGIRA